MRLTVYRLVSTALVALLLAGCGDRGEPSGGQDQPAARDITAELQAYYAAHPDFFGFKTLADVPAGLTWENGEDLPEIGSAQATKGGTLHARLPDFPRTLRTVGPDSNDSFRTYLLDDLGMYLARVHPENLELYPGLAEAWAVDWENKTVYIKLDPDATFSDGVPVTADDYLFMFWFFQSSYINAPWYNNYYSTQFTNITRYDDHLISMSVPETKPDLPNRVLVQTIPIPQHFYRDMGADFTEHYQWKFVPTTGPYVIRDEDIRKGRSITLTRLQDWWAKDKKFYRYRFNPDRIQLDVIRDAPKAFEAFKRGDLDEFGLNQPEYWYQKLPDDDPEVQAGYIRKAMFFNERPRPPWGLWINTAQPLLDNLDVRLGIAYATNWDLVIERFFRGDSGRLNTESDGYGEFTNPDLKARPFDIEQAQRYFAAAGFKQRGPDGILVNDAGQRLSFTLTSGYESLKDILTVLKQEAAKAGLEFRIELLDSTASFKKALEKKHDIYFGAFSPFLEMYPRFWESYHSDNAYDDAFLEDGSINPERKLKPQTNNLESFAVFEMDQLIDRYRASDDRAEMVELSHRMQQLHYEQASFVPGFYQGFFRLAYWRWVRFPDGFSYRYADNADELYIQWIDTAAKEETQAARKTGRRFESSITVYDQWAD